MAPDVNDDTDVHPADEATHPSLIFARDLIRLLPGLSDNLLVTFKSMTAPVAQVVLINQRRMTLRGSTASSPCNYKSTVYKTQGELGRR